MTRRPCIARQWLLSILITLIITLIFLATTDNVNIWPLRNLLYHRVTTWMSGDSAPEAAGAGELHGCVRNGESLPIANAIIVLSEANGVVHQDTTAADGCYHITDIPAGRYVPLASAAGYDPVTLRQWGAPIQIGVNTRLQRDIVLPPASLPLLQPGSQLAITEPVTRSSDIPEPNTALRRQITYDSGGKPNQLTFLYTPVDATLNLPTLLTVYPGPVESWETVSVPLAAAGYAVIAIGPAYTLDFESDIDELQRLVTFTRAGLLPGTDGQRMALLGGSYSSFHIFRLLERDSSFRSAILLGPPTDLFDLRRRFEEGSFFPPFGLDQALIALGSPNTNTERYWRYSAIYHVRSDWPPIGLMHSRDDEIVPFQQSEILAAALEELNVSHTELFFDDMPHYLLADRSSAGLERLYLFTLDFLQQTTRAHDPGNFSE